MCASDGKEYPSRCHVRLEACLTGRNIEVIESGKCMSDKPQFCDILCYCEFMCCTQVNLPQPHQQDLVSKTGNSC